MSLSDFINDAPHLMSPAALAIADSAGKYTVPPHIAYLNRALMDIPFTPASRVIVNCPFQHGKSTTCSHYFPAWVLLLFPETRIILASMEEEFAAGWGAKVKDTVDRFGKEHGIHLRQDTKAKGEWVIDGHGGGMVCKGMRGGVVGRPCDLLIIDDPLKNAQEAMSPAILEMQHNWYKTVAYGRLRKKSSVLIIMTRWSKKDLCGQILETARRTGEHWKVIKFKALAGEDDILGRKSGEALWPDNVSREQLLIAQKADPRWFAACSQQEPEDEEGAWFKPRHPDGRWRWPLYRDMGDAWSIPDPETQRRDILRKHDATRILTVDWARSKRATSDFTGMVAANITPRGQALIHAVRNQRLRLEELAPALAEFCREVRPDLVAVETGHPTLANEYRRYRDIPEIRWLNTESKDKLTRALSAIIMGQNNRIFLPDDDPPWLEDYVRQLASFTGHGDEYDDMVDATSYMAKLAQELRPVARSGPESWPCVLTEGRFMW